MTRAENRSEPTLGENQLPSIFLEREPVAYSGNTLGNPLYSALEEEEPVRESDDLFHGLTITVEYRVSSYSDEEEESEAIYTIG